MSRDNERIFRWLSEAEIEAELERARRAGFTQGATAMREAAANLVAGSNARVPLAFIAHDVRRLELEGPGTTDTNNPAPGAEGER